MSLSRAFSYERSELLYTMSPGLNAGAGAFMVGCVAACLCCCLLMMSSCEKSKGLPVIMSLLVHSLVADMADQRVLIFKADIAVANSTSDS